MKKQNKNYLSLAEQGITKAWDKAVIFRERRTEKMQMVVYYANKPFYYWPVDNAFDVTALRSKLDIMLYVYNTSSLNRRKVKRWITRRFILLEAGKRVITYRRGGVLFPSVAGV